MFSRLHHGNALLTGLPLLSLAPCHARHQRGCCQAHHNNDPLYSFADKPLVTTADTQDSADKPLLARRPSTTNNNRCPPLRTIQLGYPIFKRKILANDMNLGLEPGLELGIGLVSFFLR